MGPSQHFVMGGELQDVHIPLVAHFWNHYPLKELTEEVKEKGVITDQYHH